MKKVIVFGSGQPATTICMYLRHDSPYEVAAFTVDRKYTKEDRLLGLPVVPFEDLESVYSPNEYMMCLLISYRNVNKLKAEKYAQAKAKGYELVTYISSRTLTFPDLVVGDNCFIHEYASIGPFVSVGNDVFIGPGSIIGHNSVIKDHCFIGPHAVILASTTVEPYCVIGANSTIRDGGVTIARECIIAAGALVIKDTKERGVYVGRPAELLPKPSNEVGAWLTWGVDVHKRGLSSTPTDREKR
jgi:sugar O-acyltransferase (sialic acid O-acetyltransferase NeuD family)